MEKESHATYQQLSDQQRVPPTNQSRPKCDDTFPNELALYIHSYRNFVYCQGKCRECQASCSICDLTQPTGPCTSCRSSGKACHTNPSKSDHDQSPQQCSKCLWRHAPSSPRLRHHEESCIGRCDRCEEHNLPCRVFSQRSETDPDPTGNTDRIFCLQSNEKRVRMPM